jgi:hypothetical protein
MMSMRVAPAALSMPMIAGPHVPGVSVGTGAVLQTSARAAPPAAATVVPAAAGQPGAKGTPQATAAAMLQASQRMAAALQHIQLPGSDHAARGASAEGDNAAGRADQGPGPPGGISATIAALGGLAAAQQGPVSKEAFERDLAVIQNMLSGGMLESDADFVAKISSELLRKPRDAPTNGTHPAPPNGTTPASSALPMPQPVLPSTLQASGLPHAAPVEASSAASETLSQCPRTPAADDTGQGAQGRDDRALAAQQPAGAAASAPAAPFPASATKGSVPFPVHAVPLPQQPAAPLVNAHIAPFLLHPYELLQELRGRATRAASERPASAGGVSVAESGESVAAAAGDANGAPLGVVTPPRDSDGDDGQAGGRPTGEERPPCSSGGEIDRDQLLPVDHDGGADSSAAAAHTEAEEQPAEGVDSGGGAGGHAAASLAASNGTATQDAAKMGAASCVELSDAAPSECTPRQAAPRSGGLSDQWQSVLDILVNAEPQPVHNGSPGEGSAWGSVQGSIEHESTSHRSEEHTSTDASAQQQPVMSKSKRKRNKRAKAAAK